MTIIIGTDTGEILTGGTDDDVIKGEGGNDTLSGAAGDDELDGGTGNDMMYGGTGNDNYIVDSYNDVVIEDADEGIDNIRVDTSYYWMPDNVENAGLIHTARSGSIDGNDLGNYIWVGNTGQYAALDGAGGDDTLDATANSYYVRLSGGEGNDVLWGGSGGDTLIGGTGNDQMEGGAGDDIYNVDSVNDTVVEIDGGGTDTVNVTAAITYTLPDHVENGHGIASGSHIIGNDLDNYFTVYLGSALSGGAGDDTYDVGARAGVVITEAVDGGIDTLITTGSNFTLADNVENMVLNRAGAVTAAGNDLANTITLGSDVTYATISAGRGNDIIDASAMGVDSTAILDAALIADRNTFYGGAGTNEFWIGSVYDKIYVDANATNTAKVRLTGWWVTEGFTGTVELQTTGIGVVGSSGDDTITNMLDNTIGRGRGGDDTYHITGEGVSIIEVEGEGIDTAYVSSASFTSTGNVENLIATGTDTVVLTGAATAETLVMNGDQANGGALYGGAGDDTLDASATSADAVHILDGGEGADHMIGGAGHNVFYVDNIGDTIAFDANALSNVIYVSVDGWQLPEDYHGEIRTLAEGLTISGNDGDNDFSELLADTTVSGLLGDDRYVVRFGSVTIVEAENGGIDTIVSQMRTFTLGDFLENLIAGDVVDGGYTLTGNTLDNIVTGSSANDFLYGLEGNDTLIGNGGGDWLEGGLGDDTYHVDQAGDSVVEREGEGTDTVYVTMSNFTLGDYVENLYGNDAGVAYALTGNALDNHLRGNAQADTLTGEAGNDTLDGGAGADTLVGGLGNDLYIVDNAGDTIVELENGGTDTVQVLTSTYTASDNVEVISAADGAHAYTLTGEAGDNTITGLGHGDTLYGMDGNDVLDGRGGGDIMVGGRGDDTYYVDFFFDSVVEAEGEGTDTIITGESDYTIPDHVENLHLRHPGRDDYDINGNTLDNVITFDAVAADIWIDTAEVRGGDGHDTIDASALLPDRWYTWKWTLNLFGEDGDDTIYGARYANHQLRGGLGNDTIYTGDNGSGAAYGGDGNDTIYLGNNSSVSANGEAGDDRLFGASQGTSNLQGGAGSDELFAYGNGNTTMDGGIGADIMDASGSNGNVTIHVDDSGDVVIAGSGTSTVISTASYFELSEGIDYFDFTTGYTSTAVGSEGADHFRNLRAGSTAMGGAGDDTYEVRESSAAIVEEVDGGYDLVLVHGDISVSLSDNVEAGLLLNNGTLNGNDGDNLLAARNGGSLIGGLGNDTYSLSSGSTATIVEQAGEGIDTVEFTGNAYTIVQNVENLVASGGSNLFQYTGNDLGNAFSLDLFGTDNFLNKVEVDGAGGDDVIDFSMLQESAGVWQLEADGGDGNDTILGADDAYLQAHGGAGDDVIRGGVSAEGTRVSGNDGDDQLYASDSLFAELNGGLGADLMDASSSSGTVTFEVDNVDDVIIGGSGVDTANIAGVDYTLGANVEYARLDQFNAQTVHGNELANYLELFADDTGHGGVGDDIYYLSDISAAAVEAEGEGTDTVYAIFAGDYVLPEHVENGVHVYTDTLYGNALDNTLSSYYGGATLAGGLGNDTYVIHASVAETIVEAAGEGIDTVVVTGNYTLGDNLENLQAASGVTMGMTLRGNALANTISGGEGTDTLHGDNGNDILEAGAGHDTLYGEAGWDTLVSGEGDDTLDGGNGYDTASYANAAAGVSVSLAAGGAQDTLGAGIDTLVSIEYLVGSAFDDTLTGSDAANQMYGGAGADTVLGGIGGDLLIGEDGNDALYGEAGWDTIRGDAGDDTLVGGNGGDALIGSAGLDTLWGDAGTDRLYGGNDADTLHGGEDNDLLFGQDGDDVVNGDGGEDLVQGNKGDDTLDGGADNDTVDGGAGSDILYGGSGDDVLIGNWGVDVMTGGEGADTFRFDDGHSGKFTTTADTILDFSSTEGDVIDLSAIDAISGDDDDAFTFIGDGAFTGNAGELRYYASDNGVMLVGDTDGDGVGDLFIALDGVTDLTAVDIVL